MLSRSNFKTPFRAVLKTPTTPLQTCARTPLLTFNCSQLSTPGITVEDIQSVARTKKQHKVTAPRQARTLLRCGNVTLAEPSEGDTADSGCSSQRASNSTSIPELSSNCASNDIHPGGTTDDVAQKKIAEPCTTVSHAAPIKTYSRNKVHAKRNCLLKYSSKACDRKGILKSLKQRNKTTKRLQASVCAALKRTFNVTKKTRVTSVSQDQVVYVKKNEFVYKDGPLDSKWVERETDVYSFPSPCHQSTIKKATDRRRKEQIRLEVLETIYKLESELAVLRARRKKIERKLKPGDNYVHEAATGSKSGFGNTS